MAATGELLARAFGLSPGASRRKSGGGVQAARRLRVAAQ